MKLLEYEAKTILHTHGVAVPGAHIVTKESVPELVTPVVLKSQVPVGGRGKAGGVVVVEKRNEITPTINRLFNLDIKGFKPSKILAEEALKIDREFYFSLLINQSKACIELMAHTSGGVEVESNELEGYLRTSLNGTSFNVAGEQLAELYDLPDKTFVLQTMIEELYRCFVDNDMTLLEINPLILTNSGKLVAGDCKMELDDAAAFRHPEWDFEDTPENANFVELTSTGNVATIANGAGLAMATVDAVADAGLTPANFLDIGGGANEKSVFVAFERLMEYGNVQAIVINIFAGITRCDEVAKAIITAKKHFSHLPPLFIRLAGTNFEQAEKLLIAEQIPLLPTLGECIVAAKRTVKS